MELTDALIIVFYLLGNSGQALCIKSCREDLILTRKSHNCAGIAFIQGDSAGGSKLIEQTLRSRSILFIAKAKRKVKEMICIVQTPSADRCY